MKYVKIRWVDADDKVMVQDSKDMHAQLQNSTLHIIKGGDHTLLEQRSFLRKYVKEWLAATYA